MQDDPTHRHSVQEAHYGEASVGGSTHQLTCYVPLVHLWKDAHAMREEPLEEHPNEEARRSEMYVSAVVLACPLK